MTRETLDRNVPADLLILLLAIVTGAAIQVGVGIGFSIVAAPVMMVLLGTATAVPVLLLLNTLVSLIATDQRVWAKNKAQIRNAVIGCFVGIALGLLIYPYLSERMVLALTGGLLLVGVATSVLPQDNKVGPRGFQAISGLSGLATVWAATPGPLMILGFLASGRPPHEARRLVQPVALIAYGAAFALHCLSDWAAFVSAPWLLPFAVATVAGSLMGRVIGPLLPQQAITHAIRLISILACAVLFRRAYLVG